MNFFRKAVSVLLDILKWLFWFFISVVMMATVLGILSFVKPNAVNILPEIYITVSVWVLTGLGGILALFITIAIIRGIRMNWRDLVEWWDNIKDRKVFKTPRAWLNKKVEPEKKRQVKAGEEPESESLIKLPPIKASGTGKSVGGITDS